MSRMKNSSGIPEFSSPEEKNVFAECEMSYFLRTVLKKRAEVYFLLPVLLFYAISYFQRTGIPGTIFNQLQVGLDINAVQVAAFGATFIYVYGTTQLFIGMFVDKYGGIRVLTVGGVLFCLSSFLFPFFNNLMVLYLLRVVMGLGASTIYLALVKEADFRFGHKNYSIMLGIFLVCGYLGGLFGTLPFEQLSAAFGWRKVLIVIGIITVCTYLFMLFMKRTIPPEKIKTDLKLTLRPFLAVMKNRLSWQLTFSSAVNFSIYFVIQTVFGKKFLEDYAKMDSETAAACIFALTLISVVMLLVSGVISRLMRNRRKPLIILSAALCLLDTALMFVAIWFNFPAWVFAFCYMIYALLGGISVIFTILMQEVNSPETITLSTGLLNGLNYISVAVTSLLIGMLLDCFAPKNVGAGHLVIYPKEAYLTLFAILILPTLISFINVFFIPESYGKFIVPAKSSADRNPC